MSQGLTRPWRVWCSKQMDSVGSNFTHKQRREGSKGRARELMRCCNVRWHIVTGDLLKNPLGPMLNDLNSKKLPPAMNHVMYKTNKVNKISHLRPSQPLSLPIMSFIKGWNTFQTASRSNLESMNTAPAKLSNKSPRTFGAWNPSNELDGMITNGF